MHIPVYMMPLYAVLPLAGVVLFGMSIISAPSSFLPATEHQNTEKQTHRTLNKPPAPHYGAPELPPPTTVF